MTKLAGLALLATAAAPLATRADVPPPPGYVETCTLEKQQKAGEECQSVQPYFRDRYKGQRELGSKGFTLRCKSSGASVWKEIWCKAKDATPQGS
jgi:hypothetical protein